MNKKLKNEVDVLKILIDKKNKEIDNISICVAQNLLKLHDMYKELDEMEFNYRNNTDLNREERNLFFLNNDEFKSIVKNIVKFEDLISEYKQVRGIKEKELELYNRKYDRLCQV